MAANHSRSVNMKINKLKGEKKKKTSKNSYILFLIFKFVTQLLLYMLLYFLFCSTSTMDYRTYSNLLMLNAYEKTELALQFNLNQP